MNFFKIAGVVTGASQACGLKADTLFSSLFFCRGHLSLEFWLLAWKHNVMVICLPANTTSFMQPLDFLFMREFKRFWTMALKKRRKHHPMQTSIPNSVVAGLVNYALQKFGAALIKETLVQAFERTGIFPPNSCQVMLSEYTFKV